LDNILQFTVEKDDAGSRLDVFISKCCPDWPRTQIKRAIEASLVQVNNKPTDKAGRKCVPGDKIAFPEPPRPTDPLHPQSQNIPLDIIYEDEDVIVINKPCGLVVHPGAGHTDGTLVNALLAHDPQIARVGESDRPGIVHRLDRETSGLMLCARSQRAYAPLVEMFARHDVHRQYWAICSAPKLPQSGTFDTPYGRHPTQRVKFTCFTTTRIPDQTNADDLKRAVTHYQLLDRTNAGFALVTCKLETGRTHQVRVHLSEHGAPILGDQLYAPEKLAKHRAISRLALHAGRLSFVHPISNISLDFSVPLPDELTNALKSLGLNANLKL